MALHELKPSLVGMKEAVSGVGAAITALENDATMKALHADFTLDGAQVMSNIAQELQAQLDTADQSFTIAVVGAFKVGKSTFLNALLGLYGDQRLSTKDRPDTACSTLLRFRGADDPEARINYLDGRVEDVSWAQASNFTSQVWLDAHPDDARKAGMVSEVEYFLQNDLLAQININDLPGTGSRYWREHTELTHRKMKEADAIFWIVGEEEPSKTDLEDLRILKDCARSVVPIVNILEDASQQPPLERDEEAVEEIIARLNRDFLSYFRVDFVQPLRVSARVIELERAKAEPDAAILERAGFNALQKILEQLFDDAGDPTSSARIQRISGVTLGLARGTNLAIEEARKRVTYWLKLGESAKTQTITRLDSIEDTHNEMRARIRDLARERADKICKLISGQARNFIEDTLQLSNVKDLIAAIKKDGRDKNEEELQRRFLSDYLKLTDEPNWLTELGKSYSEDVRAIVIPAWRRLKRQSFAFEPDGTKAPDPIESAPLMDALVQGVTTVLQRLFGILALAGLLALIPGGLIIDAIGLLVASVISLLTDPLAGQRRRAVDRSRLQIETQRYEITNRLLEAGLAGNSQVEKVIRQSIQTEVTSAECAYDKLSQLQTQLSSVDEEVNSVIAAITEYSQGIRV